MPRGTYLKPRARTTRSTDCPALHREIEVDFSPSADSVGTSATSTFGRETAATPWEGYVSVELLLVAGWLALGLVLLPILGWWELPFSMPGVGFQVALLATTAVAAFSMLQRWRWRWRTLAHLAWILSITAFVAQQVQIEQSRPVRTDVDLAVDGPAEAARPLESVVWSDRRANRK